MPTDYLLDTNILVSLIRDDTLGKMIQTQYNLRAFITRCMISVITVGVIEKLARQFKWGNDKLSAMRALLQQLIWIDINDQAIFSAYAEVQSFSEQQGKAMGENDAWIAATAKASGCTLMTTDRDFDHLHPAHLTRIWIDPQTRS
ncbi:MAG: type II toxin-antitoxin system VapC family toxin [Pirellulales bacterium]|nr:type II toxin-antitoxin system VapC family toxin [Pirellulales bacterium]